MRRALLDRLEQRQRVVALPRQASARAAGASGPARGRPGRAWRPRRARCAAWRRATGSTARRRRTGTGSAGGGGGAASRRRRTGPDRRADREREQDRRRPPVIAGPSPASSGRRRSARRRPAALERGASGSGSPKRPRPRRADGAPSRTYVVPRSRATRAATAATSSPSSTSSCAPSTDGEPAQRLELLALAAVGSRAGRRTTRMSRSRAEPLRRAPRAAHDPLGARSSLTSASSRSAIAWARRHAEQAAPRAARADRGRAAWPRPSSATWRSATSRSACRFSMRKKPFSAACTRAWRVDLALAQARDQRLGREVDEHDLVGRGEHAVGDRLAHAHAGQLGDLVVERLEVLDVDGRVHVDAGVEHVGDVLVALARARRPGALVCASSSIRHSSGARARSAGRSISSSAGAAVARRAGAGSDLEPLGLRRGLRAAVRLEHADHDVAPGLGLGLALLQHAVRLADAGRHARGRSCSGRPRASASTRRAGCGPTRSMSLMPMNGAISPPRP